jgi:hypothetical protein
MLTKQGIKKTGKILQTGESDAKPKRDEKEVVASIDFGKRKDCSNARKNR